MSENGNSTVAGAETAAKKPRLENETIEEKDFDEETQKALEEIDATQNEIDTLNERKNLNYFVDPKSNFSLFPRWSPNMIVITHKNFKVGLRCNYTDSYFRIHIHI